MLIALLLVQCAILAMLAFLLLRRAPGPAAPDVRTLQMPDQLARVDARAEALDGHVRIAFAQMRSDLLAETHTSREANAGSAAALRTEITHCVATLGSTLTGALEGFRADNTNSAEALRTAVQVQLDGLSQRLAVYIAESARNQLAAQTALHDKLTELSHANTKDGERLRAVMQERIDHLNTVNAAKLEEMRATVDEKLHATLQTRLTESFGQVTTHLGEVQKGLGEMKELATGVGDLKKVLSNVRSRGVVGEFQLGQQLEQMFSPEQYIKNARIKPDTLEVVEYALKFPSGEGPGHHTLLPIDAKFPKQDWERLEEAYEHGTAETIAAAGKAFERTIRTEAERICKKYIDPPTTLPHGIMFLPTESLYAEVVRRPGLQSEVQSTCRVTIAGPSTFMAILTSFQMGFHTLAIQKKGDQVWRVLSSTKNEFEKFGGLMDKVRKQVDTVQNTLGTISGKTKTINDKLRDVANMDTKTESALEIADIAGGTLRLVANGDEESALDELSLQA